MSKVKKGDLVRMKTHDTGLVGIVTAIHRHAVPMKKHLHRQIGIKWLLCPGRSLAAVAAGSVQWEPEPWLEVVSEAG